MAKEFWEVTGIECQRATNGVFGYSVRLNGPQGDICSTVPVEAMLDYFTFQRHILLTGAVLYRNHNCEGRESAAANGFWQMFTQSFIQQFVAMEAERAAQAASAAANNATLN